MSRIKGKLTFSTNKLKRNAFIRIFIYPCIIETAISETAVSESHISKAILSAFLFRTGLN